MQALENDGYTCPEFIDDYRLLFVFTPETNAPLCLLLIDTEDDVEGGMPVQTLFHFPSNWITAEPPSLFLERGAHKASSTDDLTPFYQDPTQRIAVLDMFDQLPYLVFPVEALMKLARDHGGREIEWDEWKKHVTFPSHPYNIPIFQWVSGCRFFCFVNGQDVSDVEVYDFSIRGRVLHQSNQTDSHPGMVKPLQATRVTLPIPWSFAVVGDGRESVVFFQVSELRLSHTARLNGALYVAA